MEHDRETTAPADPIADALETASRWRAAFPQGGTTTDALAALADEVGRLRAIIRVNGLHAGATHAEIDEVIYAKR